MSAERRPLTAEEIHKVELLTRARNEGTYYDLLGIHAGATVEEVEAAYHAFARAWHPDRFYSRDTGEYGSALEENFVAATRAFRTLRDANKRSAYHREMGLGARAVVVATPPPPSPQRTPIFGPDLNAHVQAGVTSPGGTPVYQTRLGRPAAKPAPPPPPPPKPKAPPAVDRIRQQVAEQIARARQYYATGKEDFDAGRYAKAESALYLAVKFDPKNADYASLLQQAAQRAREGKAKGFITQAEQEESYQRVKEAIGWYHKAVECDPPEGLAFFRLAMLLKNHENDERGAVAHLRKAVQKEPQNVQFRMALADLYEAHGLAANALREANAALVADPKHDGAKAMVKRLKK